MTTHLSSDDRPVELAPIDGPGFDIDPLRSSSVNIDQLLDWLTTAAWISASLSVLGALYGLVMLAFGSRRAPGVIVGGVVGTLVAVVAASTVIPSLQGSLS